MIVWAIKARIIPRPALAFKAAIVALSSSNSVPVDAFTFMYPDCVKLREYNFIL